MFYLLPVSELSRESLIMDIVVGSESAMTCDHIFVSILKSCTLTSSFRFGGAYCNHHPKLPGSREIMGWYFWKVVFHYSLDFLALYLTNLKNSNKN